MNFGFGFGLDRTVHTSPFSPMDQSGLTAWYDPSDLATLFQDAEMTVPVTSDGDPVGAMLDKSGNGHHAIQPENTFRPTYDINSGLPYIFFDGVDDYLYVPTFDMRGTAEVTLSIAMRAVQSGQIGPVCELTELSSATSGTFALFSNGVSGDSISWRSRGTINTILTLQRGESLPATSVLVCKGSIPLSYMEVRRNGAQLGTSGADQGTGVWAVDSMFMGRRGGTGILFEGSVYGMSISNDFPSEAQVASLEQYYADKIGLLLD